MNLLVGTKVRFFNTYRPPQVGVGAIGVIVDMARVTPNGPESWVRARFGDFIRPWIEVWRLDRVS